MKKILIISNNPYPNGLAVANRITTLAKGLMYHGYIPKVFIIRKTERANEILNEAEGNYEGIEYKYAFNNSQRLSNKYLNYLSQYFGLFNSLKEIFITRAFTKAVIVFDQSSFREICHILMCKLLSIPIWKEESEIPEVYFSDNGHNYIIRKWIYVNILFSLYSGIITITNSLYSLFKKSYNKNSILVNMMVDFERFENIKTLDTNLDYPYICYAGSINYCKDGIDILVDAFSELSKIHKNLKLNLIGTLVDNSEPGLTMKNFLQKLEDLNLLSKVNMIGSVKNDLIPYFLSKAKILVLPRPDNLQAANGFPTKLGEYLASKTPVICTSVGEIPQYLTNGVDSILIQPGNKKELISAINSLLANSKMARKLGENGYRTAKSKFSFKTNVKPLVEML